MATGNDGLHLLTAGPIGAATFNVQVAPGGAFVYSPDPVNINVGDTVNWTWGGSPHSTTSGTNCPTPNGPGPSTWDSGVRSVPFSFQFTFNTPGSFPYFCAVHCFTGTVIVASAGPVIDISVNPTTINFGNVNVGQFLDQTITITNQATSNATLTGSVSTLSPPFSVQSGGGAFSLTPGQSLTVTVRYSPTAAGAASDNLSITHNAMNQTSPTNIPLSGTGVTTPLPDLIVSSISGPHLSKPGGRIAISNTITNQGTQAAGSFVVNFYLSTDQQITTSDIFLGKRSIKALAAGASSGPVSTNVTIPTSVTTGSYFIGAIVDPTNVIVESNEGNNTAFDPAGINVCVSLAKPKLLSPKNRGTNISTSPTLAWSSVTGASTYEVQVATDSGFTNIVASMTGLTTPQWAVTPALSSSTSYFWRSRGVNLCGPGPFSTTWSFKTAP